MIPIPEIIENPNDSSFAIREFTAPCKENIFHFHEEYELTFVVKGTGERFIGGKLESFADNDLVLIGKNTPHYYIHNAESQKLDKAPVIVVHFSSDFLGKQLTQIPEFEELTKLLENAKVGIAFSYKVMKKIAPILKKMLSQKGLDKLISLITIFRFLLQDKQYKLIGNIGFDGQLSQKDENRINIIYSFISNNYHQKVSLDEIAQMAHLSPSAFCRFFKRLSRKPFLKYLNEYRIGKACRLLTSTELPVGNIAFNCGFGNMANFNRRFKVETNFTPLAYRKKFGLGKY